MSIIKDYSTEFDTFLNSPTSLWTIRNEVSNTQDMANAVGSSFLDTVRVAGLGEFGSLDVKKVVNLKEGTAPGIIFTQTANKNINNSTTETSLIGTGVGSLTLPVNFFSVGKTVRIQLRGFFSTTGSPTINYIVKLGSTAIATLGASAAGTNVTNQAFLIWHTFTCRTIGATGTVIGQGQVIHFTAHGTQVIYDIENTTTTSIDTTSSQLLDITAIWGTQSASNTITSTNCVVEVINY